jgi:hypothetical protein
MNDIDRNLYFRGLCDAIDFREREVCKFYIQFTRNITRADAKLEIDCWWRKTNNKCFNVHAKAEKDNI